MFEASWPSLIFLTAAIFFVTYKYQRKKDEKYREADEARGHKYDPTPAKELYKESGLVTLIILVGILLLGIVRIEGFERGCSYNRYEGPDACYDEY